MADCLTLDPVEVARVIGLPYSSWEHQCHRTSLAIVKAGLVPGGRVARGTCRGVGGQHSWIVAGPDPYAPDVPILDPTLWSFDSTVKDYIWHGSARDRRHVPHGAGSIWSYGKPSSGSEPAIALTPAEPLSRDALLFLDLLGPLDRLGWQRLAAAPVGGWPAGEIFAAMDDTPALSALVPIDKLGMTTYRNPGGLYF